MILDHTGLFSVQDRDRVRNYVLQLANSDARVVAGAVVGSLALNEGDRWSDLDLTFAVEDDLSVFEVLDDWTQNLVKEFDATHLFDLTAGPSIYRVFLIPGCLQFDLSFTPASQFGATGPKFKMIFGDSIEKPLPPPPSANELFGYAVHHALRARFCIERGRYWQAEYWISSTRDYALSLACLRRGLAPSHGRGFDTLPKEVHEVFVDTFAKSLERDELLRALGGVITGLLSEVVGTHELAAKIGPQLKMLAARWGE